MTESSRRAFLKNGLFSAGAMALLNPSSLLAASPVNATKKRKPPMRFIFMNRGNGLFPSSVMVVSVKVFSMDCLV